MQQRVVIFPTHFAAVRARAVALSMLRRKTISAKLLLVDDSMAFLDGESFELRAEMERMILSTNTAVDRQTGGESFR